MKTFSYEAAVQLMRMYPTEMHFIGPCSEEAIVSAEKALGLTFPTTYRSFVRDFGAGHFGGFEVYGILCEREFIARVPNGVWLTTSLREEAALPDKLLVISADGMGGYYCLDCNYTASSEAPVVLCYLQPDSKSSDLEIVAADFSEFLLTQVQRELEDSQLM